MAEALGVAASVISVVAFAGQLAQSSSFHFTFLRDIRNAPKDVRALSDELRVVASMLIPIQQSPNAQDPDLGPALKHCDVTINNLSAMLQTMQPAGTPKKRQQLWRNIKTTLGQAEISKHLAALERFKSMLLQCCATTTMVTQNHHSDALRDMQASMSNFSHQQSTYATSTADNKASIASLTNSALRIEHSTATTQSAIDKLNRLSSRGNITTCEIQNTVKGIDESMSRLSQTASQTQGTIESIHHTTSALMGSFSRLSEMTSQTSMTLERLTDETITTRETTERIESASQDMVEEIFRRQPVLLQAFGNNLKRTITRAVRQQMREI
ncbi:hypothetical protein QQZ08_003041 [Neonectria magnoliae]|uniref:Azaphilone pigments biosynthesis cluster protein L N-terminal domain-containing protein n=1 Tax=Neonectria magnoliae TaxID=2732573 RepID=A0ABR1IC61_9HYPO